MVDEVVLGNVMVDCDDERKLQRFYGELLGSKVMWKELWMELQTLRRRWTDISRPSTIRRMKWIF